MQPPADALHTAEDAAVLRATLADSDPSSLPVLDDLVLWLGVAQTAAREVAAEANVDVATLLASLMVPPETLRYDPVSDGFTWDAA